MAGPPNLAHFWGSLRFSGVPKMVLPVPESKIRKHFSIQIPPQNLGKMTSGMHFDHSKVVFRPFYTFCTFCTNLRGRNDKMVLFQVKFHPAKQDVIKNIRPSMESSWSPLSKNAITFKFMKYLGMVLACQRKSSISRKLTNWVDFQVKFHPAKNFRWPPKFSPLVLTYQKPPKKQ